MQFSNKTYDVLKFVATVFLPAFTTLVGTIGVQLGYEMTTAIVILTAIDTFIGTLIGLSSYNYQKEE